VNSIPGALPPVRPAVDAGRLWAGGAATALVAALVALVGVLIWDTVLEVGMVAPWLLPIGDSFALRYALTAAALALVATGVAHLLASTTPRPRAFFSWIVGLSTLVGVVLPFAAEGSFGGRFATASVNLIIGLCVLSLLSAVLARTVSVRRRPVSGRTPDPGPYR
jgi:Family of unknown function (DUF6069)